MHRIANSLLFLVVANLLIGAASAADTYAVTFEPDVAMKTRDGVTLYADIFRRSIKMILEDLERTLLRV